MIKVNKYYLISVLKRYSLSGGKKVPFLIFYLLFFLGHALASQSANLYMDSAILAVQYALRNEKLEPTRLSEYNYHYKDNGVDGTVKYFEGSLSGLSKVERYYDCDGPQTISGTTTIDCTLVFDRLKASHKGKFSYGLHEVDINVKGNIHSIYIKVGIVKSIYKRNPQVKSIYFLRHGSMDTYFTGLGPLYNQTKVLQDIYETAFKTEALINIEYGFHSALNVTVASLPMPVD